MEAGWIDIITRFLLPPILGGAGGLIAIWANWGVEKRRLMLAARRELLRDWRTHLLPLLTGDKRAVVNSPFYSSLRSHLSKKVRIELENTTIYARAGSASDYHVDAVNEEFARIEKEWKLV